MFVKKCNNSKNNNLKNKNVKVMNKEINKYWMSRDQY